MRTRDKRLACHPQTTHISSLLDPTLELRDRHVDVDDHVWRQVLIDGDLLHLVVVVHTCTGGTGAGFELMTQLLNYAPLQAKGQRARPSQSRRCQYWLPPRPTP